ncbi:LemA family protein [Terrimonas rubra]|uniref:LemA family protein n=1 Tax=Terrimonas rubra TaxID=1035890 RepID=A0ABW6A3T8_9BACT
MKGKSLIWIIVLVVIVIIGFMGCNGYNGVIKQDENVKKAWGNVEVEYQKRADLTQQLINTVQGAADFERKTLTDVIEARAKATGVNVSADNLTPENVAKFQEAQSQLTGALSRLMVVVERYPDLKANQNFLQLQTSLEGMANGINTAQRTFNSAVNDYNVKVRSFPMNILAGMFGFKAKEGFKAEEGANKAPDVKFNF